MFDTIHAESLQGCNSPHTDISYQAAN